MAGSIGPLSTPARPGPPTKRCASFMTRRWCCGQWLALAERLGIAIPTGLRAASARAGPARPSMLGSIAPPTQKKPGPSPAKLGNLAIDYGTIHLLRVGDAGGGLKRNKAPDRPSDQGSRPRVGDDRFHILCVGNFGGRLT